MLGQVVGVTTEKGLRSRSTSVGGREKRDAIGAGNEIRFSSRARTQTHSRGGLLGTIAVSTLKVHVPENPLVLDKLG